ncbi:MAG: hypothetical protein J6T24_02715 [Clostridia bacterium]|nr:hypothetical protein [Clostridia bacterium]
MSDLFPRTTVGGVSLPRMIMGVNWLFGWSHTGPAADAGIREKYQKPEDFFPVFKAYMDRGVDAILGPFSGDEKRVAAVRYAEDKLGKRIKIIDSVSPNVDDTPEARREAAATIHKSREIGADVTLIFHANAEALVNKNKKAIPRLPDYLAMIRDEGLIPGLSAHMPELVTYSDMNGYDVETYIQIYNCLGFLMQVEVESVARIINTAKKPVITIKPMAAGRCTPYVGFNFVWNTIRDCDMVCVGAGSALEVEEDVEISLAALERRYPKLGARSSPVKQDVLGHK